MKWFSSHRQRALKALDERLSKTGSQPQTWPSMDEAGSSQDEQDPSSPPSSSSHPPSLPPPDMIVVEKIPGGAEGERGGGEGSADTAKQLPPKSDPAT